MSKRLEAIKRLAETDDYWKGYLDGMRRTREADAAEWGEYARLAEARLDRAEKPRRASFMSDKISMDEARARAMREGHSFTDPTDYDQEWTRMPATGE